MLLVCQVDKESKLIFKKSYDQLFNSIKAFQVFISISEKNLPLKPKSVKILASRKAG